MGEEEVESTIAENTVIPGKQREEKTKAELQVLCHEPVYKV